MKYFDDIMSIAVYVDGVTREPVAVYTDHGRREFSAKAATDLAWLEATHGLTYQALLLARVKSVENIEVLEAGDSLAFKAMRDVFGVKATLKERERIERSVKA